MLGPRRRAARPYKRFGRDSIHQVPGSRPLHIALIGTRGAPAQYGGFETAVDEIGQRLVERGHRVTVYCKRGDGAKEYRGMRRVEVPAVDSKILETLSRTCLATLHAAFRLKPDVAFVFNSANSFFVPILHAARIPVALHMDGIEWKRAKWGKWGKRYYRKAEAFGVHTADALIADAQGIAAYYRDRYDAVTEVIAYGAQVIYPGSDRIRQALGLEPNKYTLIVARIEPENHVLEALEGAIMSRRLDPIVVVGSVPYESEYAARVKALAGTDHRVRMLGGVWDQDLLDELYGNARLYLHGHSVGGTNPSLLRAMGCGAAVAAYDVTFNREVLHEAGAFWTKPNQLAKDLDTATDAELAAQGELNRRRANEYYRWPDVSAAYEGLARRLGGRPIRRQAQNAPHHDRSRHDDIR